MWPEARRAEPSVFRLAFSPSVTSTRKDVEQVMAARVRASLVVVFLAARLFHLTQAAIAITVARSTFTRPPLAEVLAAACLVESVVLGWFVSRTRELSLGVLVCDGVFAAAGLVVMSSALSADLERMTGSLDWMLPYSVATCAGLGLVALGRIGSDPSPAGTRFGLSHNIVRVAGTTVLVVGLASTFVLVSVLPAQGADPADVAGDALFYPVFFTAAASLAWLLQSRVRVVAAESERVQAEAAEVARQAQWRVVLVDVFGPSLDLFERAAIITDEVPESLQREAGRPHRRHRGPAGSHALGRPRRSDWRWSRTRRSHGGSRSSGFSLTTAMIRRSSTGTPGSRISSSQVSAMTSSYSICSCAAAGSRARWRSAR